MEDSIFTRIIKGEIPGEVIYEDDSSAVLMTIEPLSPGHCLVVPKEQIDHLWDMADEPYQHLMSVAKTIAQRLRVTYGYERVGMIVEGFGVAHAHIHVFGYLQPLQETIIDHAAHKEFATPEQLHQEAEKLRQ